MHFLAQKWAEVKRGISGNLKPAAWASARASQRRSGTASPFDPPFTSQLTWRASLPYRRDATSTSRIQTGAAESPGISRTSAYAIDHMDDTQPHLTKVGVE